MLAAVKSIQKATKLPIILTRRIFEQGGASEFNGQAASKFWQQLNIGEALCDLEGEWLANLSQLPQPAEQIIASHHDFQATPDDLETIYDNLKSTAAGILKIAVTALDITDCLAIFRLLQRAKLEEQRLIALAMGESGILTRILGPAYGSWLTFAPLNGQQQTAPGQLRATELLELYRFPQITKETPVYGLIGWPVSHSFSPQIHNKALIATNLAGVYLPLAVRDLGTFIHRMVRPKTREIDWDLRGLSITAPHKQAIIPYLDHISPEAQTIGAVNTVVIKDNALVGYNTDVIGFVSPLQQLVGDLRDARCLVLGAGGAARCALWALRQAGAIVFLSARDETKAKKLTVEFGISVEAWSAPLSQYDIVVNATTLGARGLYQNETPATAAQLSGVRLAYDLVYNPPLTPFLLAAQAAGCAVLGGLPMLVAQAAAQFSLWTGHNAPLELMQQAARDAIS